MKINTFCILNNRRMSLHQGPVEKMPVDGDCIILLIFSFANKDLCYKCVHFHVILFQTLGKVRCFIKYD